MLRSVEVELFSQHGDHTRYLFLLAEAGIFWPGLEAGGHHVVDPCEDLHDLKLLAKLIKNITKGLNEPGPSARIPPGIITWYSRVCEQEVCLYRNSLAWIGISLCCVIGRPRVCLYAFIKLRTPTCLDEKEFGFAHEALAHVSSEERGNVLYGHCSVRAVNHALLAVA